MATGSTSNRAKRSKLRGITGAKPKGKAAEKAAEANRRLRYGPLPKPPETIEVPYADERPELASMSCGEKTAILANTQAFKDEIVPILDELDAKRALRPGPAPSYTSLELELCLLYQHMCKLTSYRAARDRLAGDRAREARKLFGMTHARPLKGNRVQILRSGIPSEATISRHLQRFGHKRRKGAHMRLARRLRNEHFALFPEEMGEEARLLNMDGSPIKVHATCPIVDPKTGEIINANQVTCPEGGYMPPSAGVDKSGHGFSLLSITTNTGLPLASRVIRINDSESVVAADMLEREVKRELAGLLDPNKINHLTADGGFNSPAVRRRLHDLEIVGQIHRASHGDSQRSKDNAEKLNKMRLKIEGYPTWQANGHRELICDCGQGRVSKRFARKNGKLTIRSEGECEACGSISITTGRWMEVKNYGGVKGQSAFRRCRPGEYERADLSFGNPLTFNDPMAEIYGHKRFGHGEGFHAMLATRWKLLKQKRWFYRAEQPETEAAIIFSIMHALAMEQRRRAARRATSDPPTQALAA
jgi:hypothetical protein